MLQPLLVKEEPWFCCLATLCNWIVYFCGCVFLVWICAVVESKRVRELIGA